MIELLVVFSISAIIAAVVIASYPNFSSQLEFDNQVLDIALTVREAQVYGISVKEGYSGAFGLAYGVYFDNNTRDKFILFKDNNSNEQYNTGEELKIFTIKSGFEIKNGGLCAGATQASAVCFRSSLHVSFKRPNPDAVIIANPGGFKYKYGGITIRNTKTLKDQTIRITNTGQLFLIQ